MHFDENEVQEFKAEAEDLLQDAENHLLNMEQGEKYNENYSAVFRALHSLKGASGMLGLEDLRSHMHKTENIFQKYKDSSNLSQELVTFFLRAFDAARGLLHGETVEFNYELNQNIKTTSTDLANLENRKAGTVKSKQKLIYIIDDEEDNLEIISGMIKNQNYRYECFLSAQEALTRSEESPPDLVLTDMRMPGLSGIDVLKSFKQIDSEISIIFISGHLDKTTLMEALNLGVFAVIDKPIKELQLNSYITQALARREMWRILNKSIDLILFQINDMGNYLISQNKSEQLEIMKQDARQLLESRRALKAPRSI